jgi:hypothetical protein
MPMAHESIVAATCQNGVGRGRRIRGTGSRQPRWPRPHPDQFPQPLSAAPASGGANRTARRQVARPGSSGRRRARNVQVRRSRVRAMWFMPCARNGRYRHPSKPAPQMLRSRAFRPPWPRADSASVLNMVLAARLSCGECGAPYPLCAGATHRTANAFLLYCFMTYRGFQFIRYLGVGLRWDKSHVAEFHGAGRRLAVRRIGRFAVACRRVGALVADRREIGHHRSVPAGLGSRPRLGLINPTFLPPFSEVIIRARASARFFDWGGKAWAASTSA